MCKYCTWWVNETETIGDYQHEEARKQNKGFCLLQDLFTYKKPDDFCDCNGFLED